MSRFHTNAAALARVLVGAAAVSLLGVGFYRLRLTPLFFFFDRSFELPADLGPSWKVGWSPWLWAWRAMVVASGGWLTGRALGFVVRKPRAHSPPRLFAATLDGAAVAALTAPIGDGELVVWALPFVGLLCEWAFSGGLGLAIARTSLRTWAAILMTVLAWHTPLKWQDMRPVHELPSRTMTLAELDEFVERIWYFPYEPLRVTLPTRRPNAREIQAAVRAQHGLDVHLNWCGTGSSALFGGHPMGVWRIEPP